MVKVILAHAQQFATMLMAYYLVQLGFGPIAEQIITKLAGIGNGLVEFVDQRKKFLG